MTERDVTQHTSEVKQQLAQRFGLTTADVDIVTDAMDQARGTLGPEAMSQGLAMVVKGYVDALAAAAERFADPAEREIADRLVNLTIDMLAGQLEAAATSPH